MRAVRRSSIPILAFAVLSLGGCSHHYLAFGTATKFALDIAQRADQTVDVTMGYDRAEIASIPAPAGAASKDADAYAVLGTFDVSYGNPWTEPLLLRQVFATGIAARNVAATPAFREAFGKKAGLIEKRNENELKKRVVQ
jgi:hypothetical protein